MNENNLHDLSLPMQTLNKWEIFAYNLLKNTKHVCIVRGANCMKRRQIFAHAENYHNSSKHNSRIQLSVGSGSHAFQKTFRNLNVCKFDLTFIQKPSRCLNDTRSCFIVCKGAFKNTLLKYRIAYTY